MTDQTPTRESLDEAGSAYARHESLPAHARALDRAKAAEAQLAALQPPAFVPDKATRVYAEMAVAMECSPNYIADVLSGNYPRDVAAAIEVLRKHLSRGPFDGLTKPMAVIRLGELRFEVMCDTGAHRDQWLAALDAAK